MGEAKGFAGAAGKRTGTLDDDGEVEAEPAEQRGAHLLGERRRGR